MSCVHCWGEEPKAGEDLAIGDLVEVDDRTNEVVKATLWGPHIIGAVRFECRKGDRVELVPPVVVLP